MLYPTVVRHVTIYDDVYTFQDLIKALQYTFKRIIHHKETGYGYKIGYNASGIYIPFPFKI